MSENSGKEHVSIAVCGHVDAGKSTTTGNLIFSLGGIPKREMEKLEKRAEELGKSSFKFAFYLDTKKDEQERGVTISTTTKEFFTDSKHYTILDTPGHRDFIKNMLTGASQADCALLLVPADGNFITSIARGDRKKGEVQGQTRHHALLLNLLGVKQLIIGINKMDSDTANYSKERYEEIKNEVVRMLTHHTVGWKKDFVTKSVPFIPLSGFKGDNLIEKSTNMDWWQGVDIKTIDGRTVHVHTLLDALDQMVTIPDRPMDAPLRVPISGVLKIPGVGDVLTGRIEQGTLKPNQEVKFVPTHTTSVPCTGKVFSIEMHHKKHESAGPGLNVGMNVKALNKSNMPKTGDVMVLASDTTIDKVKRFTAQVKVLECPNEIKVGYSPVGFVRTGRSACRLVEIRWKIGKETGKSKLENPPNLKKYEMAEVVFEPQQPFACESFKNCEGLGRIAMLDGGGVVMLGKVVSVETV